VAPLSIDVNQTRGFAAVWGDLAEQT